MTSQARSAAPPPTVDVCAAAGTGTDFTGQDLHDTNFNSYPPGSLRGAKFDNANLRGASFAGQDLTAASFRGATLGASAKGPAVFTHTTLDSTCFAGANLNDAQFEFARIHCADFSGTSMVDAQFGPRQWIAHAADCRTRFIGTTLDVHAITRDHWRFVDFTDAKFVNYTAANFNLAGIDLTGAMLAGTVLPDIDMSRANLTAADLSRAKLINAVLEDATLNGANLTDTYVPGGHLRCARFFTTTAWRDVCPKNPESSLPSESANLSNVQLRDSHLDYAVLDHAQMRGAILDRTTATHVSFDHAAFISDNPYGPASFLKAALSQAIFGGAKLKEIKFDGTILPGADFSGTELHATSFESAVLSGANFSGATLEGVNFKSAELQSANFNGAKLQTGPSGAGAPWFPCANLGGGDFSGADVLQANFAGAVMPATGDCCPAGADVPNCGTAAWTGLQYGPTKLPVLSATNVSVVCPNGDHAPCSTWRLPGWKTDLCGATGDPTNRVVWTKPDCGSQPSGDAVQIDDDNLRACVRDALPDKPAVITKTMAATVAVLRCANRGIAVTNGLDAFKNLRALDLSGNLLQQFDVSLPGMHDLNVANNQLTTLNVASMVDIDTLNASNNQLVAVGGIFTVSPQILNLSGNQLAAFDLAVQQSVIYANLSGNHLTSIVDVTNHDLSGLSNLAHLDVSGNALTTIGSVKSNTALSTLILACNPSFDCGTLGVDPSTPAVRASQCAVLDKQNNVWTMRSHPPGCQ